MYKWEVYVDGALVYSVKNEDARVFEGANVWTGSFWAAPNGEYDNFSFTLDNSRKLYENALYRIIYTELEESIHFVPQKAKRLRFIL